MPYAVLNYILNLHLAYRTLVVLAIMKPAALATAATPNATMSIPPTPVFCSACASNLCNW